MNGRARAVLAVMALAVAVAACGGPGVTARRSSALPEPFDREVPLQPVDELPDVAPMRWGACGDRPEPWECGVLQVPLDYRRPDEAPQVAVVVTRLPAAQPDRRIGSLVLNPGGPGASGVDLAWSAASTFPSELVDRFDIVGFDPRGVGRSTAVDCGDLQRSYRVVLHQCVARSGDLLPYVGTQNAARDLEMLRIALGDEQLTYLGFSYGTALGAVYADLFPQSLRAAVLDGSVDPDAGRYNVDGTVVGSFGSPFYGFQDFDRTLGVFLDLCDATRRCPAGPDSGAVLDDLYATVGDASVEWFDDWDPAVTADQLDGVLFSAMYNTDTWMALAIGVADAAEGDASTLAALASLFEAGYPRADNSFDNLVEANAAIYCADFAGRSGRFAVDGCVGWPETNEPLSPITAVDVDTPIVVIGTDDDPATPGELAPLMADALGDAVSVRWQGAGHTAFQHSDCIDRIVVDYLVDLAVPADRTRCGFTDDRNTTVARAEQVFTVDRERFELRLTEVFVAEGLDALDASCVARGMVALADDRELVYARLGVQRREYTQLRNRIEADCGA